MPNGLTLSTYLQVDYGTDMMFKGIISVLKELLVKHGHIVSNNITTIYFTGVLFICFKMFSFLKQKTLG